MTDAVCAYPKTLIVDTEDLLKTYVQRFEEIWGIAPDPKDINEILTQIFSLLLNGGNDLQYKLRALPDYNYLRCSDAIDYMQRARIKEITAILSAGIHDRMTRLGGWTNDSFPYVFDRRLGNDVVLCYLPF